MSRSLAIAAVGLLLTAFGASPVGAEIITPGGGSGFGEHVACMTPEHSQVHGQLFGGCISAMATGGTCVHHS